MKFSILLFLVSGMIFSNVVLADEFSDALFSLQTEARAQANYFGGLIEEYREMADQGKIRIENVSVVIQISANGSQQSRLFWLALEKSFET